jgi:hypothetical protein
MTRFVTGVDHGQTTLLPECLDDWVEEGNPVRAVDVFVEALDLASLGFEGVQPLARVSRASTDVVEFLAVKILRAATYSALGLGFPADPKMIRKARNQP